MAADPPTAGQIAVQIMQASAGIIWSLLAAGAFVTLLPQIRGLFGKADQFEAFGIKVSLKALAAAGAEKQVAIPLAGPEGSPLRDRLAKEGKRLNGAEILWVDDRPSGNHNEAQALMALGAHLTFAASTAEAEELLRARPCRFDLVLSDWARPESPAAGPALLAILSGLESDTPFIFYVGQPRDLPPGAQGLATRPDQLLELILDALKDRG
ncbi:DNA-binding transcriptional response regulator [Neoroseomonas lacus]|uniref:Response regulator n=1 Tax=Neoroseomonas lacus TaxID=287609 RepID=A0A917K7J5_9PROT|nr:hypothetical protein [Neoroseomonas lacus]GGJ00568.1 response regulator [Neoroseomonas lacus]